MVLKGLTKISMAFKELTQRKKLAGRKKAGSRSFGSS